jgi:hypothetical protein
MTNHLNDLKELAARAFYATSHVPEQRGQQIIEQYEAELSADLEFVRISEGDEEQYIASFKKHLSAWLTAHSRCMSTWVTGAAKFPIQKAARANAAEQKRLAEFQEWRKRAIKALIRWSRTPGSEVDEMTRKIAEAEAAQEHMKQANTIIRKHRNAPEAAIPALMDKLKLSEKQAQKLITPDVMGDIGYAGYRLTNNNANIRRMKERLVELQRKEASSESETKTLDFTGGYVDMDFQADRIRIHYPGKPDANTITKLKRNGFRWSPSQTAWQRQLTTAAIHSTIAVADDINIKALFDLYHEGGR